jgi:hypothetical protein
MVKKFIGGSPQTQGPQGPPHQQGVFALKFDRSQANKSFQGKISFFWAHSNPWRTGSTPPKESICFLAIMLKFGTFFSFHLAL